MPNQHPIQHALASFLAFVPEEDSLRTSHYSGLGEYVLGEYAGRRQVFVDYYRAIAEGRSDLAPHLLFARSGDSIEKIRRFTEDWGPLRPNTGDDPPLRLAFGKTANPQQYFAFHAEEWRARQKEFVGAISMVEENDIKRLLKLLPYQHQRGNPVRAGALYPYFQKGAKIKVLKDLWTAEGQMTTEDVRQTAKRLGIFLTEKGGPEYQMVFEAVSLMDAFWHMLLLDLTAGWPTMRTCANAKCRQPFLRERVDQKYCSPECTRRAARLAYYHRKGAADRRRQGEIAKRTKKRKRSV